MGNITISAIVPIHQSEKYLPHLIQDICKQVYMPDEIIFVVNGCTDQSLSMCMKFITVHANARVLESHSVGVSYARNMGLEAAKGTYVAFLDADDSIAEDYFYNLKQDIINYQADIACCGICEIKDSYDGVPLNSIQTVIKSRVVEGFETIMNDYFSQRELYMQFVWGKLICRDLALKERFDTGIHYGEDVQYLQKLSRYNPRISLNAWKGYAYIRWPESTTKDVSSYIEEWPLEKLIVGKGLVRLCEESEIEGLKRKALSNYEERLYEMLDLWYSKRRQDLLFKHHRYIRLLIKEYLQNPFIERKHHVRLSAYCLSVRLFIFLSMIRFGRL